MMHSLFPMLALFALPSFLLGPLLQMGIPVIAGAIVTALHLMWSRGESWYANANHGVQVAIGTALGLLVAAVGIFIVRLPGGDVVVNTCANVSGPITQACLDAIGNLISSSNVQLALTAILSAAGLLGTKLSAIHTAQKSMAIKAGVVLPPSAR